MEVEIQKIRSSLNAIVAEEKEGKEEMIADEKKQENKANEFKEEEFRIFEEEMKAWRVELN